jgi:hypothetical protein
MGNKARTWVNLVIRRRKPWGRFLIVIMFVFATCLLTSQISSRDLYYVLEPTRYDYVPADDVMEPVAPYWHNLQQNDVSFGTTDT